MITGFEYYTKELTYYEKTELLPVIVRGIQSNVGEANAITNKAAVEILKGKGLAVDGPRFRKLIHVIRVSGMVEGIVASSKGYYIAETDEQWSNYIKSLGERIKHTGTVQNAIINQYDNWRRDRQ